MKQGLGLRTEQRLSILGRLRMAEWIEMPESEYAKEVERVERDPLFRKLYFGAPGLPAAIRRRRWPSGSLAASFYDFDEGRVQAGERVDVEGALDSHREVVELIRRMGRGAFERYFLHAEESAPLPEIARRTGMSEAEIARVHDLLLGIGAQAEFAAAPQAAPAAEGSICLARIVLEGGRARFEFAAPYWARGLYQVRYDGLEDWKRSESLDGAERRRLRHLLKRLETLNLRQSTIFRVLEALTVIQADYLATRRPTDLRPVSLRLFSKRLQLAPSTVSRALARRTVRLPWGAEAALISLLPGQRFVLKEVLSGWLTGARQTDASLAKRLRAEKGITVSRRTVNAVRHQLAEAPAE